jgi:hypothetical protein
MASVGKRFARRGPDDAVVTASEREAIALTQVMHFMDAATAGRETMELDLRSRRVVQALGLGGPTPTVAVAQGLGISPPTMTGLADRLEREGGRPGAQTRQTRKTRCAPRQRPRSRHDPSAKRTTFPRQR